MIIYKYPQPKIVSQIKINLDKNGIHYNKTKKFVIVDKENSKWEKEFEKIVAKEFLQGNTINCIESEVSRFILYDLSYAWIEIGNRKLDYILYELNLISSTNK